MVVRECGSVEVWESVSYGVRVRECGSVGVW